MSNQKSSKKSTVKDEVNVKSTPSSQVEQTAETAEVKAETTVNATKPAKKTEAKEIKQNNKPSFLGGTIKELRLVSWPKFGYVARWSAIIIAFTFLLGATLGFVDYYSGALINFVDCTSPKGRGQEVSKCLQDLSKELTFQDYLNRSNVATTPDTNTPDIPSDNSQGGNTTLNISEPTEDTPNAGDTTK